MQISVYAINESSITIVHIVWKFSALKDCNIKSSQDCYWWEQFHQVLTELNLINQSLTV